MNNKLVKGRIVRYVISDQDYQYQRGADSKPAVGESRPAMVTSIQAGKPCMTVFSSFPEDGLPIMFGRRFVEYDRYKVFGTWHWPNEEDGHEVHIGNPDDNTVVMANTNEAVDAS